MIKANIEKEYKVLITKEEYDRIIDNYHLSPKRQINYYYNSDKKGIALRTRYVDDRYLFTLKDKNKEFPDEYEFEIRDNTLDDPRIIEIFDHFQIIKVSYIGELITDRSIIAMKYGEICIDHSYYLNTEDYEIEYELYDANTGDRSELVSFLKTNNIADIDNKHGKFYRFANLINNNKL